MPHLVLKGKVDLETTGKTFETAVHRWGRAVLKVADTWKRSDGKALLVEGVVVELSRPLHPVAVITAHESDTIIRLWSVVSVERTPAIQRWMVMVASALQSAGAGPVLSTNLIPEALEDAPIEIL